MPNLQAGVRLGPYTIVSHIGAGGMGEVWRATDTRLDRAVAIKILPPEFAQNPQQKIRFEREARAISQLNHPNICTVHDVGNDNGMQYIVMELLDGETLADRLTKGPLPVDQVLRCGIEIASALDRAHHEGIVHRDIKPGNVVLTKSGAKLLDFGLAKSTIASPFGGTTEGATHQKPLTQEGAIVGTVQYMAPEQISGEAVDARTDIFAFGAVLYEMLTGTPAFRGKNRTSLVAAIVSGEPEPISSLQPLTPPALERVVKTCLAKDPDDRWQTAHDVMLQLEWIDEGRSQAGVAAPIVHRRRIRERTAWWFAAAAIVAAIALGFAYARLRQVPNRVLQTSIEPSAKSTLLTTLENSASITISPDGRLVTFAARGEDGKAMLWLRPLDAPAARPLEGTEGGTSPFWSPDSRNIAFFSGGKLKKIDLNGAPPLVITDAPNNPRSGSWSESGMIVFSPVSLGPIFKVPASGGPAVPATTMDVPAGETTHRWASFLPDGKHFLFMVGSHSAGTKSDTNAVYVGSLDDPKARTLVLHVRSNAVYASGHLIYVRDDVLIAQPFDVAHLRVTGDASAIARNVHYDRNTFRGLFAVSNEGTVVYHGAPGNQLSALQLIDRSGKIVRQIGDPAMYRACALSPDGTRIALAIEDPGTGLSSLWIQDLARSVRTRLTFGGAGDGVPVWSPDGRQIAFGQISKIGTEDVLMKDTSGTGSEQTLVSDGTVKEPTSWSPDGRYIAYASTDFKAHTRADIWVMPLSGDRKPFPFIRTPFNDREAAFSPDGHWMAYSSDESGQTEVYLVPFPGPGPGGKWQVSANGGFAMHWRSDGRELTFVATDQRVMAVPIAINGASVTIGTPEPLFSIGNAMAGNLFPDHLHAIMALGSGGAQEPSINVITNWPSTVPK